MDRTILVIENEGRTAGSMRGALAGRGFEVAVARNGEEGLWRAVAEKPDAVILDARLPYLNGWDTCAEIKNNHETRGIPVVIIVPRMDVRECARSLLAGSDACIPGPVDPARCVELIEYLIQEGMNRT